MILLSQRKKEFNITPFLRNENYRFIEGDIRNKNDLAQVDDTDIIVHLAAKAGVRQSIQNSILYHEVNDLGTHNMLD